MGRAKFVKATTAAYMALLNNDEVDDETVYFVSEHGDFDPSSLTSDSNGEIWLGGTKIGSSNGVVVDYDDDTLSIDQGDGNQSTIGVERNIVSVSPTAGGIWDKIGSMTVKRIKGSGCLVWNQIVRNGDFSEWDSGRFLPNQWSSGQYITSTYFNVGRIEGGYGIRLECKQKRTGNSYMYCNSHFETNHTYFYSVWIKNTNSVHIGDVSNNNQRFSISPSETARRVTGVKKITEGGKRLAIQFAGGVNVGNYAEISEFFICDLTAMFGAGNEPTYNEFNGLMPYSYYDYSAKTLLGNKTHSLKTVGYNLLFNGVALIDAGTYKIEGNYTSLQVKTLHGSVGTPSIDSSGLYTCASARYFIVEGWDGTTCLHRDVGKTGYETPWSDEVTIDIASLACKASGSDVSEYPFPYGLLAIGNVKDEIVCDEYGNTVDAVKRIGVRDYASGDDSDNTVVTDGTHTAYVLSTEAKYSVVNPVKVVLRADGFGEEMSVPATNSGTDVAVGSLPCLLEADYKCNPVSHIEIDNDVRDIEDWRIKDVDIEKWNTKSSQPSSSTPLMDGTAAVGTDTGYARGDHRHPTDTSRAADNQVVHKSGDEYIAGNKEFAEEITFLEDAILGYDDPQNDSYAVRMTAIDRAGEAILQLCRADLDPNDYEEDETSVRLNGIQDPVDDYDAVNKQYVDNVTENIGRTVRAIAGFNGVSAFSLCAYDIRGRLTSLLNNNNGVNAVNSSDQTHCFQFPPPFLFYVNENVSRNAGSTVNSIKMMTRTRNLEMSRLSIRSAAEKALLDTNGWGDVGDDVYFTFSPFGTNGVGIIHALLPVAVPNVAASTYPALTRDTVITRRMILDAEDQYETTDVFKSSEYNGYIGFLYIGRLNSDKKTIEFENYHPFYWHLGNGVFVEFTFEFMDRYFSSAQS